MSPLLSFSFSVLLKWPERVGGEQAWQDVLSGNSASCVMFFVIAGGGGGGGTASSEQDVLF